MLEFGWETIHLCDDFWNCFVKRLLFRSQQTVNRGSVCNLSSGGRPCNCCFSVSRLLQRIMKLLPYALKAPFCQLAIVSKSVMMLKGGSSGQPSEVEDVQIPAHHQVPQQREAIRLPYPIFNLDGSIMGLQDKRKSKRFSRQWYESWIS